MCTTTPQPVDILGMDREGFCLGFSPRSLLGSSSISVPAQKNTDINAIFVCLILLLVFFSSPMQKEDCVLLV